MKYFFPLLLVFFAFEAKADFEPAFYSADGNLTYVDYTGLIKNNGISTMWTLVDLKKTDKINGVSFKSLKQKWDHDCKRRLMFNSYLVGFSGSHGLGQIVFQGNTSNSGWSPVVDGSIGEVQWKIACGLITPH